MEIKELTAFFVDKETNILDVTFRLIEDSDDIISELSKNTNVKSDQSFEDLISEFSEKVSVYKKEIGDTKILKVVEEKKEDDVAF
jgi:hypothetical protein